MGLPAPEVPQISPSILQLYDKSKCLLWNQPIIINIRCRGMCSLDRSMHFERFLVITTLCESFPCVFRNSLESLFLWPLRNKVLSFQAFQWAMKPSAPLIRSTTVCQAFFDRSSSQFQDACRVSATAQQHHFEILIRFFGSHSFTSQTNGRLPFLCRELTFSSTDEVSCSTKEPSLMLLVTCVLFLQWQLIPSAERKVYLRV